MHTEKQWRPIPLLACLLAAAGLYASYAAGYWVAADHAAFALLNGMVAENRAAQIFWALVNNRAFDGVLGAGLCAIWYAHMRADNDAHLRTRMATLLVMVTSVVVSFQIFRELFPNFRDSPSLVVEGAHRISQLVPWAHTKDESTKSFPGDHATVLLMMSVFITYYTGRKYMLPLLVVLVAGAMPRMVGGAHWLTDVVCGGGAIALIGCSLVLCTPLKDKLQRGFERLLRWRELDDKIIALVVRLPRLG